MIFLDTNIIIEYLKGNDNFISAYKLEEMFINDIVLMELYQGAKSKEDLNFIIKNISQFKVLNTTHEIVKLSTMLVKRYNLSHNLKILDAIIASTSLVYNLELLSLNQKDFRYIDGLKLASLER